MIRYQYWVCDCGVRAEIPICNATGIAPLCPMGGAGDHPVLVPMKPPEQVWISCAAIKTENGRVWVVDRPGRHCHVIEKIIKGTKGMVRDTVEGFVTTTGTFLDRAEALELARDNGQLKGDLIGSVLTSEDLW